MSDKDLVYFKQGIPAGQQMDKYSENPGMLLSKNADIFSSSNSYKATAFSTATAQDSGIVDMDDKGRMILKSNGDVVDTANNNQVILNVFTKFTAQSSYMPLVDYDDGNGYVSASFGTLKRILVKYEGDTYKTIVVFSDRMKYCYSTRNFIDNGWEIVDKTNMTITDEGVAFGLKIELTATSTSTNCDLIVRPKNPGYILENTNLISIYSDTLGSPETCNPVTLNSVRIQTGARVLYNAQDDMMQPTNNNGSITMTGDTLFDGTTARRSQGQAICGNGVTYRIRFRFNSYSADKVPVPVYLNYPRGTNDYNEWFEYLPLDTNRNISDIGEFYFTSGKHSATIMNFEDTWVKTTSPGYMRSIYKLVDYMAYDLDPSMKAVDCVVFDEKVYLICNKDGNGYIYPCDLSGGKGTPYIAYGVEFKSAIVLNYLIYLVGENRGVSTLFVYSGTELVHIIEGNKKSDGLPDYVDNDEQYKFNGMMADWRGKLVLGTSDNRIFCYGQTFGGRGGSFIQSLASGQTLNEIKTVGKDLYIKYTEGGVVKTIKYQNDVAIKNYNTDFEIVYPVIIGSHIIEKEVYDLVCSYILPSSDCSLEFWLAVNHYYFWTFRIPSKPTIAAGDEYFLSGATGTNVGLTFVEKDSANGEWYTFRLSKNLPIQNSYLTANMKLYKPVEGGANIEVAYTEFNHFKKIGEITADGYKEGYDRFNNINTKNGFPRTHSLQLMVKGHGTANYTPEVFGVNLVSNQRDRG